MTKWKTERCSTQPSELQRIGEGLYMQRRNIEEVHHEAEGELPAYNDWECECRELTESEYNMLLEQDEMNALILLKQADLAEQQDELDEAIALILLKTEE